MTLSAADMKKLTTQINTSITKELLMEVVTGVIEDVKSGQYPDNTPIIPGMFTVGQLRAIQDWDKRPDIMVHVVAAVAGRFLRSVFHQVIPNAHTVDHNQLLNITMLTENVERAALAELIKLH